MPLMTKEERKEYNKKYYNDNKKNIIEKACNKLKCELCGRNITLNGYNRHQKTKLCLNTQEKNKYINSRLETGKI